MILFTRVYPKSGTLEPVPQWSRYHHLQRVLMHELSGSELFVTPSHGGSISRSEGRVSLLSRSCVDG